MRRKMTGTDFVAMDEKDLIGWWLFSQHTPTSGPEDYAAILDAYDAYGRKGVAEILGTKEYTTADEEIQIITHATAKSMLTKMQNRNDFTIFSVDFVKRTDGEYRKMVCRFGVTSQLKGGPKAYNDSDHEVKTVFDVQKQAYRSIALESIIRMKIHSQKYAILENLALCDKFKE